MNIDFSKSRRKGSQRMTKRAWPLLRPPPTWTCPAPPPAGVYEVFTKKWRGTSTPPVQTAPS